jgi:hypothetical protein
MRGRNVRLAKGVSLFASRSLFYMRCRSEASCHSDDYGLRSAKTQRTKKRHLATTDAKPFTKPPCPGRLRGWVQVKEK